MTITTIGLDLAKTLFQIHAEDAAGAVVVRKQIRRNKLLAFFASVEPCLVGLEACASSHYWARQIRALGHTVRLMPPQYVKPYVKRNKNDMADAEAICEAVTRPNMRFVSIKSTDQQATLMLHRARDLMVKQHTSLINALRGHMSEFGIIAATGKWNIQKLIHHVETNPDEDIPVIALPALKALIHQIAQAREQIDGLEKAIIRAHKQNPESKRLATIPGIGPITASALSATITDATAFTSGRQLAAWLGLTPKQHSSGGKDRLGRITKQGDRYLRQLLVIGATSMLGVIHKQRTNDDTWALKLLERKPPRLVTIALANKMARIVWAIMTKHTVYIPRITPQTTEV